MVVIVLENNALLKTRLSQYHSGWTSYSRELSQVASGAAKCFPLCCFVPFETDSCLSAYAVLFCLKFSFLSPLYIDTLPIFQGLASDLAHSKSHWTPPPSAVLNSHQAYHSHTAAHFGDT